MKFLQRLGRSLMLPVAVLPIAAVLSGFGYWVGAESLVGTFLAAAGGALLDNIALLFAVGVAIGMSTRSDGTSALAGLVSWLTVTTLLSPETMAKFQGIEVDAVNPAFANVKNVFIGIICGLIGAWAYDRFKDVKLPDYFAFFSGKRSVAIISALVSIAFALVMMVLWPLLFSALVHFGEFIATLGPVGAGIYGFLNRLLIPFGLHHALNAVFWFDGFGIADLNNFLAGEGTYGVTGQYMTGFFPIMMFGLPGAALAMYVTADSGRKKRTAGILLSAAFASFLVGVTEPLEFLFMFLAPGLFVVHALFMGLSLAITTLLPVRSGFGFSAGFIDLLVQWANPMAQNPWMVFPLGLAWFLVYFVTFRWIILKWNLRTPGRGPVEEDEDLAGVAAGGLAPAGAAVSAAALGSHAAGRGGAAGAGAAGGPTGAPEDKYLVTADRFITALGGADNIEEIENCATRLRMQLGDVSLADEKALKRAGAAGVMKTGGHSYQVIYGLNVQFVKDAMEDIMEGVRQAPSASSASSDPAPAADTADAASAGAAGDDPALAAGAAAPAEQIVRLRQPVAGAVIPLDQVEDQTFASGMLGVGAAIDPTEDTVVAPAAGTVVQVMDTGHAVAMTLNDGTELLIHIGLDTVKMGGNGFEVLAAAGDQVRAGDPLVRFDRRAVEAAGYSAITPVVLLGRETGTIEFV